MAPWLFLRISAIALIILFTFKFYAGLAAHGRIGVVFYDVAKLHGLTQVVDIALLFFLIFHALYGVRLILIDLGAKWDRLLFWLATLAGIGLFGGACWFLFAG